MTFQGASEGRTIVERLFYQEENNPLSLLTGELLIIKGQQESNKGTRSILEAVFEQDPNAETVHREIDRVSEPWDDEDSLRDRVREVLSELQLHVAQVVQDSSLVVNLQCEGWYTPDLELAFDVEGFLERQERHHWKGYSLTVKLSPDIVVGEGVNASGYTKLLFQLYNTLVTTTGVSDVQDAFFKSGGSTTLAGLLTKKDKLYILPNISRDVKKPLERVSVKFDDLPNYSDLRTRRPLGVGEVYLSEGEMVIHTEKTVLAFVRNIGTLGHKLSYVVDMNEPPLVVVGEKETVL